MTEGAERGSPLAGQAAVVTGATGALGRAVVKRLLEDGALVVAVYRDETKYHELVDLVCPFKEGLAGFKADLTAEDEIGGMFEAAVRRFGRIDALLNLAGAYRGGTDLAETSVADWDFLMETNLKTAFLCSRAVLPVMIKAGRGRIVNVAARPAVENRGRARSGAYAVSKAGVVVLTAALAEETRKFGITVNCVVPATIDTPQNRARFGAAEAAKGAAPEDIAAVIAFLISDASAATSGAAVPVYGRG